MTLFDIVMKNLKYNFKQYFIYIASMTFSILIYFTFVSLRHNEQITNTFMHDDKLQPLLHTSSFILLLFVLIFIWYSNAFFMNKRKQEIGLYSLLGAPKKEIGLMLFYENFLLSIVALVIGIGLGELFSVFFSMILVKLMGYPIIIEFSFNTIAIIQTSFVFLIIAILTSLQGYTMIYRFKLITLFQAKNKSQDSIKPSFVTALLSFIFIGISYWILLNAVDSKSWDTHFGRNLLITISLMIIGTYLLFRSLSGLLVQFLQNKKSIYYKWRNLLTFTQLKSRLKSNAIMLTAISVLNGLTLVAFGFAYTIYYNTLHTLEDHVPFSYQYEVTSGDLDQQITATIQYNEDHPLLFDDTFDYFMIKGDASALDTIPGGFTFYEEQFAVLSETTYNKLAQQLKRQTLASVGTDEAIMLGKNFIGSQNKKMNIGRSLSLFLANEEIPLKITGNKLESLFNYMIPPATLIVNDAVYEQLQTSYTPITSHVFKVRHDKQSADLTEQVQALFKTDSASDFEEPGLNDITFYSFSDDYQEAQSIYGLIIFTFGFLGLVFLSATGSIIYFKMLTEVAEDRQRYITLQKVGLSRRKIRQIIARQYIIVFLLPLIIGIIHSCMMLNALSKVMDMNFNTPVLISMIIYSTLYGLYYRMTLATGNKLVNS